MAAEVVSVLERCIGILRKSDFPEDLAEIAGLMSNRIKIRQAIHCVNSMQPENSTQSAALAQSKLYIVGIYEGMIKCVIDSGLKIELPSRNSTENGGS